MKNIVNERSERYASLKTPVDPQKAAQLIDKIAGVYKTSHVYQPTGEESEKLENILEIVKVTMNSIHFRLLTNYGNAHGCEMDGVATYNNHDSFIYDDLAKNDKQKNCVLKIIPSANGIKLEKADTDNAYMNYCSILGADPNEFFGTDGKEIRVY